MTVTPVQCERSGVCPLPLCYHAPGCIGLQQGVPWAASNSSRVCRAVVWASWQGPTFGDVPWALEDGGLEQTPERLEPRPQLLFRHRPWEHANKHLARCKGQDGGRGGTKDATEKNAQKSQRQLVLTQRNLTLSQPRAAGSSRRPATLARPAGTRTKKGGRNT